MRAWLFVATSLLLPLPARATPPELVARERARVEAHLGRALDRLEARDVSGLSADQRAARADRIEALRAYRAAGRFPENRSVPHLQPVFRDARGTLCAMAHLIASTGRPEDAALVDAVARTRNLAYIHELADEPALVEWLEGNGLTVEEAAAIQPTYVFCTSRAELVCPEGDFSGAARVERIPGELGPSRTARFRITEVLAPPPGRTWSMGQEVPVYLWHGRLEDLDRAILLLGRSGGTRLVGVDAQGRAFPAGDPCGGGVTLSVEELLEVARDAACIDRLDARDPAWASGFCVHGLDGAPDCSRPDLGPLEIGRPPRPAPQTDAGVTPPALTAEAEPSSCRTPGTSPLGLGVVLAGLALLRRRPRT